MVGLSAPRPRTQSIPTAVTRPQTTSRFFRPPHLVLVHPPTRPHPHHPLSPVVLTTSHVRITESRVRRSIGSAQSRSAQTLVCIGHADLTLTLSFLPRPPSFLPSSHARSAQAETFSFTRQMRQCKLANAGSFVLCARAAATPRVGAYSRVPHLGPHTVSAD